MPVFERLASIPHMELKVFYGCNFPGTKVVTTQSELTFPNQKLLSLPLKLKARRDSVAYAPLSPMLIQALNRFRPDVVICEGASNMPNDILAMLYCWWRRTPMIYWSLGEIRARRKSFARQFLDGFIHFIERRMDAVICYSSIGAEYFKRIGVAEERIFVAVNVVDTDRRKLEAAKFLRNPLEKRGAFNVLYVGALEANKNVAVLLKAFARLETSRDDCSLSIVGDGPERASLEELSYELGLSQINFLGQRYSDVSKFFLMADVFVLPGLGGLAVSDALVHGVPVICGIGDGSEVDLIQHGKNGFIDDELSEEKILFYLTQLRDESETLLNMKNNTHKTIEKFGIDNYIQRILAAIDFAYNQKN